MTYNKLILGSGIAHQLDVTKKMSIKMNTIKLSVLIFTLFLSQVAVSQDSGYMGSSGSINRAIEYSMDNSAEMILENPQIHSISIGVYKDGATYMNFYGEVDKGRRYRANHNSIFEIGSVTKTFTAYLTAKAVLDGKMSLTDDIRDYLDGSYPNLTYKNRPILVKDILTHTSGLHREQFSETLEKIFSREVTESERNAIAQYNSNDLREDLKNFKLGCKPGKNFRYSGFVAPEVLALVLENVYEKSYNELLNEFILNKAKMPNTVMEVSEKDKKHVLNGYTTNHQLVKPMQMPLTGAGGGLKSTVPDMLRYIEFLLSEKNKPLIQEMQKPLFFDEEDEENYGYFWNAEGEDLLYHTGGTGGSLNWLVLLPTLDAGFTISFNYNGDGGDDAISDLASMLISDIVNYPTKNAHYFLRNEMNKNPENWQESYHKLKKEYKEEYNFDDTDLLNDFGYELLSQEKTEQAIEVFQLLVSEFPNSANAYDSLGEGYFKNKEYELALENYKKSVKLNGRNRNAKQMIREIESMNKENQRLTSDKE